MPATQAYICLGSNTPDAAARMDAALQGLRELPHAGLRAVSPRYETEPQDYADQPWFLNQIAVLTLTDDFWTPEDLLRALLDLEQRLGRVRSPDPALRYGPRAIDIDLLIYGEERRTTEFCTLPHPRMTQRAFVLLPLRDVAPDLLIEGKTAVGHLERLRWHCEGYRIFQ